MKRLIPFAALALLSSCSGVSVADAYLAADRATFDAVAPDYEKYVLNDKLLSDAAKGARMRLIASWKMRLEANEK